MSDGVVEVSYVFFEAFSNSSPGNLPEEIIAITPESYKEDAYVEHVPVDLAFTSFKDWTFDG